MRTLGLLLAGLAGIGLLTWLCGSHHGPHFAADVSARTTAALRTTGIGDGVNVSAEGLIVTLRGQVPSQEIRARVEAQARQVWGIDRGHGDVRNLLTVVPPAPPPPKPVMSAAERKQAVSCQAEFNRLLKGEKIQFQTGSDAISPKSHRLLDRLAAGALRCPTAEIVIEGHTDSRGSREMNIGLSQRRAAAVEKYLEGKGVQPARLTSQGFGPDKPVASNKSAAGMEKNRRTELRVKGL